jgi:hypothetical protein
MCRTRKPDTKVRKTRAVLANRTRYCPGSEEHTEAKREHKYQLAAETIEHISQMVAEWPPLTAAQRDRLSILLNGGEGA